MRLQDKVAIITGAASGIGAGTAEVFAEQGARLVLVDRDGDRLEATAQELPADRERVVTYAGDVADPETARGAERMAREAFGGIDILFNNAGVMTSGDFREVDEAYTTSKAGIIGLTKALAVSYATQGIRVNCICPGWVDTPMNQRLAEELGGMERLTPIILKQQPNGRMLSTREIGNAVAFLASDEASGITGAALYVDGGASAAI